MRKLSTLGIALLGAAIGILGGDSSKKNTNVVALTSDKTSCSISNATASETRAEEKEKEVFFVNCSGGF